MTHRETLTRVALLISLMFSLVQIAYSQQPVGYSAQCTLDQINEEDILIQDNDTVSLRFNVTDADLTDLSGFQSLCAVRLDFSHRNISDLEMILTAPNGRSVTLIGPAMVGGATPAAFDINFDIFFVAPPAADAPQFPLMSPWSNLLGTSWTNNSTYEGIYYAAVGDWSIDFDEGSVLGIWELTIIDHFLNEEGILRGFELDFCEDAGLVCDVCESDAGSFVDTSLVVCANSNIDLTNVYNPGNADPIDYTDDFIIYDENGNFVTTTSTGTSSLDSGSYTVHALNILTTQYDTADSGLHSLQREDLLDSVGNAGGVLCMSISDPFLLEVIIPDTIFIDTVLCFNQSFVFEDATISTTGLYQFVSAGCDTVRIINVEASNLDVRWDIDTVSLDCTPSFVQIGPFVAQEQGSITYQWTDETGQVIGVDSMLSISIPGEYSLRVADDVCDTSFTFVAIFPGEDFFVDLTASPTQLNCVQDSTDIFYTSNFSADSVLWFRDGVEIARGVSILNVREEAEYVVEIYGESGCVLSDTVDVTSNQNDPVADVNFGNITCTQGFITVDYSTSDNISQSIWLSENDTLGLGPNIVIDSAGDYRLFLIGDNLCESEFPFTIESDVEPLMINDVPSGLVTLNCSQTELVVTPDRDDNQIVEEYWIIGVDDTIRGMSEIVVTEATSYRYQVITDNGCRQTERFDVVVDTLSPNYILIPDSVTCQNSQPEIVLSRLGENILATFSGDHIVSQSDSSVVVSSPGLVQFEIEDVSNGCIVTGSYDVTIDESIPDVSITGDSMITCAMPQVELVADLNGAPLSLFYWIRPDLDSVFERSHVTSDTGIYYFEAVGLNGCFLQDSFYVSQNDFSPSISLPDSIVIDCSSPNAVAMISDSASLQSVKWIVEGDTLGGASLDRFTRSNSIELQVVGLNGCSNSSVIDILYDTLNPQLMLVSDTLNCNNDSVEITPDVALMHHELIWAGQDVSGLTDISVVVTQPGAYAVNVIDTLSGCDTLVVIDIMSDYDPPTYSVLPIDTITCDRTNVDLSLNTFTRNEVTWTTSDGRVDSGPTILSGTQGVHVFSIEGSNGCMATDSLTLIEDMSTPQVNIQTEYIISCDDTSHDLLPTILDPFRSVRWNYKSGVVSTNLSQTIVDDDLESLVVTGDNGCPTEVTFNISYSDDNPIAIINSVDTLNCSGQPISLTTDPVVSPNHRTFWTLDDNQIEADELFVEADISGEYILEVIDTSSGCGTFDTISIIVSPDPLISIDAEITDETCLGNNDGMITIVQVNGGFQDLEITANGEAFGLNSSELLPPGDYLIQVEDELGCTTDSILQIENGGTLSVNIGSDIEIERGDKATIIAQFTGDPVDSITWVSDQGSVGINQDTFCFYPTVDEFVFIEAISESGCIARDTVFVRVILNLDKVNMYVPNILSLESIQGNNELQLSLPPDIIEMRDFQIFDRWGQKIVSIDRLINGEVITVWDGRFNDQKVASGVYVFTYEILTVYNDQRLRRNGDITIID